MSPLDVIREALAELRRRRPGCPDPACNLCKRFALEDAETDTALAAIESRLARLAELESALHKGGRP